jgi:hypothetical protein
MWSNEKRKRTGWYWLTPKSEPHPVKIFDANFLKFAGPVEPASMNPDQRTFNQQLADL